MQKSKLLLSASMMAFLTACSLSPEPLSVQDTSARNQADLKKMFEENEPISGELSLSDAIARALMYNLDHRAKAMEQALAISDADLSSYELLPTLTANAGYDYRSAHNATNSSTVGSDAAPGAYTYSADKGSVTGDLTLGWNVLDFGVSYFNARQNSDRALIAEERRRKVIHNLVKEVQRAYWRMVAAQKLEGRVKQAVVNAKRALEQAERVEAERLRSPEEALNYQKRLLQNLSQLQTINQELASAKYELAALINVAPSEEIRVQAPANEDLELPEWQTPVEEMVELAFHNNPDLREKIYLSRISVAETKKSLMSVLPGLSLDFGRNYDDSAYLDENRWFELSTSVSWNLFNLLKLPARQEYAEKNEQLAEAQRLALRMAVMAQVHVAKRQYQNAVERFKHKEKMFDVDTRLAFHMAKRQGTSSQGTLNRISQETATIASELMRYQAYSDVMASIGQMHSTLGIGIVPSGTQADGVSELSKAVQTAMKDWRSGTAIHQQVKSYKAQSVGVETVAAMTNGLVNAPKASETEVTAPKAVTKPLEELKSGPHFIQMTLNEGPGETPVYKVKLSCDSLTQGEAQDGWVELSGVDQDKNNRNGWVHNIYLMQGKLQCKSLASSQS